MRFAEAWADASLSEESESCLLLFLIFREESESEDDLFDALLVFW
jgi:hypothetical protein